MEDSPKKLGLIVNPVAGLGGRVGLKGSDGREIQQRAIELGAVPQSLNRTVTTLEQLKGVADLEVHTWPGEMGEGAARSAGIACAVSGSIEPGNTSADDTRNAAGRMLETGVDLLLFAGGDGTARDIHDAIGTRLPVLGIPAGVKIHSAAFATSPVTAAELASLYLEGRVSSLREAEVMDLDEEALRRGEVSASLYGYLKIPYRTSLVQSQKTPSGPGEEAAMEAIAGAVTGSMADDTLYIIGPGTTTRAIMRRFGLEKTLIGVDVVENGGLAAEDVNESGLLSILEGRDARIVVTPVGGQGCIFGRGNQQISPEVIKRVGRENIIVVSTVQKINSMAGHSLWIDTGDPETDSMLQGYMRVVTGYDEEVVCRVAGGSDPEE